MENLPKTIDEVLETLDLIIDETVKSNNFLGIFAYIYRRTTAGIKQGITDNRFEDAPRMEKMDVLFANLYIQAYYDYKEKKEISQSWKVAFDAQLKRLTIIQHIMMGMNAHINLDLGVAACRIMENQPIDVLEKDFMIVNDILAELVDEMQVRLAKVSRFMFILDWVGQKTDEKIVSFSMVKARDQSWRVAKNIWALKGEQQALRIKEVDGNVAQIGQFVGFPKSKYIGYVLWFISFLETRNVAKIIDGLRA